MPDTPERDRQGFSREFVESLPPRTAIVDRMEPPASELALLSWPKSPKERAAFHRSISRIVSEMRDAHEDGDKR